MRQLLFVLAGILMISACKGQPLRRSSAILTGADQTESYLPLIQSKKIGIVANATSIVNGVHLVDTLQKLGIQITAVFAPEHGFRGEAEAGENVRSGIDTKTGLKVISLYGNHKKPTSADLKNMDMVLFDIQDVGVRFYTYISTLQYVMEACAKEKIPVLILDRPNPHGFYIDGPVLDTSLRSFVGMCRIPIVHGMTIAEYALMLNGENWLADNLRCELFYIKMKGWDHRTLYELPVKPSPNLPDKASVMLYPSLCLFEGTPVSVGRGTDTPFRVYGYPESPVGDYYFTPESRPGLAANPPQLNKKCRGFNLTDFGNDVAPSGGKIYLNWLLHTFQHYPDTANFFTPFFDKLAGTTDLREQIRMGWNEEQIRNSWGPELENYRLMRKRYLLYRDFE